MLLCSQCLPQQCRFLVQHAEASPNRNVVRGQSVLFVPAITRSSIIWSGRIASFFVVVVMVVVMRHHHPHPPCQDEVRGHLRSIRHNRPQQTPTLILVVVIVAVVVVVVIVVIVIGVIVIVVIIIIACGSACAGGRR